MQEKKVKYPQNIPLKKKITDSGKSITFIANKIGYARQIVSDTVNGHYKGMKVVPLIEAELK